MFGCGYIDLVNMLEIVACFANYVLSMVCLSDSTTEECNVVIDDSIFCRDGLLDAFVVFMDFDECGLSKTHRGIVDLTILVKRLYLFGK